MDGKIYSGILRVVLIGLTLLFTLIFFSLIFLVIWEFRCNGRQDLISRGVFMLDAFYPFVFTATIVFMTALLFFVSRKSYRILAISVGMALSLFLCNKFVWSLISLGNLNSLIGSIIAGVLVASLIYILKNTKLLYT